ncbi:ABC transporter permease [Methylobacterium sp. E-045]|uniref:ABC transporter permease n=1 Tax=Methylobacterium sp. E-045 TaxID=2836575 RepID=UPI001FBBAD0A|nr:ABC transporter permease [Methylobacterium sp. E-045]MCJ2132253.1 ABC transporter permease [Methylobacterium sp. E-045]
MTALIIRDFGFRFRNLHPALGALLFIEPVIVIVMIAALRIFLFGKEPPFGSSVLLFMGTGVFPFYIFRRCARGVRGQKSRAAEYYFVRPFDFLLSRFFIQSIQNFILMVLFFSGLYIYGIREAAPWAPEMCLISLFAVSCLAFGLALINSSIRSYFPSWGKIYAFLSRPMMMFSGAFKTVDLTPEPLRTIYSWNPLSHVIELFRVGFYPNYPHASFDAVYLTKWCTGIIFVGILFYNNKSKD